MFDPCLQGQSTGDAGPGVRRVNAFVRKGLQRLPREWRIRAAREPAASRKRFCSQGVTAFGPKSANLPAGKPAASRKRLCSQGLTAFGLRMAGLAAEKGASSRKRFCSQGVTAFVARGAPRRARKRAPSRKRLCSEGVTAFSPRTPDRAAPNAAPSRKRLCSQGLTAFTARRAARAAEKRPRRVNAFVHKGLRHLGQEDEDPATRRGVTSRKRLYSQGLRGSARREWKQWGEKTRTAFQCLGEGPTPER